jgi:diaminohydroxyphosphoribosylaminopyrimidine deaminase / 5-amino-6-(5-phosphoribosylamino)uracil reductase
VTEHDTYMERCFELALKGLGYVAPNPLVGCVIVKDEKIIAEAYHMEYGKAHAEVNAILSLSENFDYSDCTLYVNLEPCSHQGKTPPCSDLIIKKNFKRVVISNVDTNPLVGGKGIERLKKAGIEVEAGILEKKGRELNKRFFTFHEKQRPYIILKWAETNDGYISRLPLPENKNENWITGAESKKLSHQWRAQEQAIMVGTNTVMSDDPQLTVRLSEGKNPLRIVLDRQLRIPDHANVFDESAPTLVFTDHDKASDKNINYIRLNREKDLVETILFEAYKLNISSMIIEGGAKLLNAFIAKNFWDEARIFVNPAMNFMNGIEAPEFNKKAVSPEKVGNDLLYTIKNPV